MRNIFETGIIPPLNGERLVIPVLFGAKNVDIGVDTRLRHGLGIGTRDLGSVELMKGCDGLSFDEVGGDAQVRGLRNRRTQGDKGAY